MEKKGKFYSTAANAYITYSVEDNYLTYKYDFICERGIQLTRMDVTAKQIYSIINFDIKYNN